MQVARHWRLKAQRYQLQGYVCLKCGQAIFPPRPVCPHCTALANCIGQHEIGASVCLPPLREPVSVNRA